jgi:hypothetical protein
VIYLDSSALLKLTVFIAYDHRLAEAASTAGLELLAPGA